MIPSPQSDMSTPAKNGFPPDEKGGAPSGRGRRWTVAAAAVALALYAAALSNEFYRATSPPALSWHVALRKSYSILAFALVGWLARRAWDERGGRLGLGGALALVAAYSLAIEIGQFVVGSREGLAWNAFDVACGAIGGALASLPPRAR
jgi:hypothetical protein